MSDIHCAVCNEPWDSYGVRHGDMAGWEAKLFRAGAGCPSCKGLDINVDPDAAENHTRDLVLRAVDDGSGGYAAYHGEVPDLETRPKWEPPPPQFVGHKCTHCEVGIVVNPDAPADYKPGNDTDGDDIWLDWYGGKKVHYNGGYCRYGESHNHEDAAEYADPDVWPKIDGKPYCPGCVTTCDGCSEPILDGDAGYGVSIEETGGSIYFQDTNKTICGSCLDHWCIDCGQEHIDCDCEQDDGEDYENEND